MDLPILKHKITRTAIVCFLLQFNIQLVFAQEIVQIGLVAEMVYLKNTAKKIAIQVVNDTNLRGRIQEDFVNQYHESKTMSDQISQQLIADCYAAGSVEPYLQLNQLLVEQTIADIDPADYEGLIKNYLMALKKYESSIEKLKSFQEYVKLSYELHGNYLLNGKLNTDNQTEQIDQLKLLLQEIESNDKNRKSINIREFAVFLNSMRLDQLNALNLR